MIVSGLFAALPTPVSGDGRLDLTTFDRLLELVTGAGVDGVCVGGATAEYPHFECADRIAIIRRAAERLPRDCALIVAIGASSTRRTLELAAAARDAGSRALLLPMPMFIRYEQDDLYAYCRYVSRAVRVPCLLYDLPDFTNGLAPETTLSLLRDEDFIVGIKDSSGRPENLARFSEARDRRDWTLLVGDDRLLHRGLQAGWNGGISGLAACCPELLCGVHRSFKRGQEAEVARLQGRVDELAARVGTLPAPWGVRIALAARGVDTGPLPLPLAPGREAQIAAFTEWFREWMKGC